MTTDRPPQIEDAQQPDVILDVRGLEVTFATNSGKVPAVRDVDISVARGETIAVVGESGSGKSTSMLGLLGLFRGDVASVRTRSITFAGRDMAVEGRRNRLNHLLGREIGVIFQDPQSSLNPTARIGRQIGEVLRVHHRLGRAETRRRVLEALDEVGIPDPGWCARAFPHELSGGMRQRAMIAMATIGEPSLLVADEPTTALDVTLQSQIVDLLIDLQRRHGMAIVFITHDLSLVSGFAERTMVMYAGQVVEAGPTEQVVNNPTHPYSRALVRSVPTLDGNPLAPIAGRPPDPRALPEGCAFSPRCDHASDRCSSHEPPIVQLGMTRRARCWLAVDGTPTPPMNSATMETGGRANGS